GRALMLRATRRQIACQCSRCLILEQHLDAEVEPEPVLEVGNEKHGRRGIHAQSGKFRLRVDTLGLEIQAFGELGQEPSNDLGLSRLRFQAGARAMDAAGAVNAMFWPSLQERMGVPPAWHAGEAKFPSDIAIIVDCAVEGYDGTGAARAPSSSKLLL